MTCRPSLALALPALLLWPSTSRGDEPVDLAAVTRIRTEGFEHSQVMETLSYLTDVIGPRLTGSPQMKQANEWTRQKLESWGLARAHVEGFGFVGPGWTLERVSVQMVAPQATPLFALPKAWTPATPGPVRGAVTRVSLESEADFAKYKGTLAGKIVFTAPAVELKPQDKALSSRYSEKELEEIGQFEPPSQREGRRREDFTKREKLAKAVRAFLAEEKPAAVVEPSSVGEGVLRVGRSRDYPRDQPRGPCSLVMAAEHYNRILRLLDRGIPVEVEVDVRATFHDAGSEAVNTFAEIPGTDKSGEVVMLGAHLDSWHGGTGATDNAAGTAAAMEAVRILKALGFKPRRTIRVALWSGEEQGLLGSRAYVREHFATRPEAADPSERDDDFFFRTEKGPLTLKPEHAKLSAYFNLDNGSGKIRGIYLQGNSAVAPIFKAWLEPFLDLGAATLTARNTGGTDHLPFDAVGLPGFQFIQDGLEYGTLTHHTNMDVLDRAQRNDLMQASVILASFAYHAAQRESLMPRKELPREEPAPKPSPSPEP